MTIAIEDILPKTLQDACAMLTEATRKRMADVTLYDLILGPSGRHRHLHGVYLIFSPQNGMPLYIGRVRGPQFIERFPAHFALGKGSWQNVFLKHHQRHIAAVDLEAAAIAASDCELLLLLSPPEMAAKLEALLIRFLHPTYINPAN
jgi:hypothetical protein